LEVQVVLGGTRRWQWFGHGLSIAKPDLGVKLQEAVAGKPAGTTEVARIAVDVVKAEQKYLGGPLIGKPYEVLIHTHDEPVVVAYLSTRSLGWRPKSDDLTRKLR
jgi:hypothetical protein